MSAEICPDLKKVVDEVTELALNTPDDQYKRYHRVCAGKHCNYICTRVDVLARRLPTNEDFPDKITVNLEVDGFSYCEFEPEEGAPSET